MRTRVKICGITRVEDALSAADAGADAIGLVFYEPSPRAVGLEQAAAICAQLPPFITVTALFVDPEPELVAAVCSRVSPDLLQFHGKEPPEQCRGYGRPYIKALRVRPALDLLAAAKTYDDSRGLLLDAYRPGVPGGTGETFDWNLIPRQLPQPVVLAGGLCEFNVARAIKEVAPYAVDVSGGVEAAKGIKDPALVKNFLHEVRCAEKH
ncbi:phosphoribosylanthranilate isomerase [Motiliproteus sp. SC1-56]|uniref:phosphoribosylanthranilate isomerase n=1 Tax=Motiliproteus sp. SC1-56 TaxID=2799565 RepID=UPI001A8FD07D